MSQHTLYDKVWEAHTVDVLPTGQTQIFIGLHLVHEVTSPQAFAMMREQGLKVAFPERTFATADHIVPTDLRSRPFLDPQAEEMMQVIEGATRDYGIPFYGLDSDRQGIVHVIGPQLGLTQPGITLACGDSHTATHGAFGNISMGIGTTQIKDVLATQTLALDKLRVRRISVNGKLAPGVYAKDVILSIIHRLGVGGGRGYAYEYGGSTLDAMTMDERLTVCNMSIEGGALVGYVNPDDTTFEYLRGRPFAPAGDAFDRAVGYWRSVASGANAQYDDIVELAAAEIEPTVTWGINPSQSVAVSGRLPAPEETTDALTAKRAYEHTGFTPGSSVREIPIDVAFVGSCTNSRISDLRAAAQVARGRHVAPNVRAIVVPGSYEVKQAAEAEGLDGIFREAGFEWREAGCSMCLAMNPDKLVGREVCASSSNRNFIGRQGSATGRTILMSPAMVAAAAVSGHIEDVRELL